MHKIFRPSIKCSISMLRSLHPPNPILFFFRDFSHVLRLSKKERVKDPAFNDFMTLDRKVRKVKKMQELILSQPNSMLSSARLDVLSRRLKYRRYEAAEFVLKYPHVFDVFEHPVQRILYCRLTRKALFQIHQENEAIMAQIDECVTRLRKLLMLSNTGWLGLRHVWLIRKEFGFPEDFQYSIILKHPQFFRLFKDNKTKTHYVELVERDPRLAVCAIEKRREQEYRQKGRKAINLRFAFAVSFPPGFKTGMYYKIALEKWQRLPYWSPYEDVSGYDIRSFEARKRMEKRAVAMIHEIISLTIEKRISMERIARFKMTMYLPIKLKDFLLRFQGIFYITTRGNEGKLHTIFLREAYYQGELIKPNDVYLVRSELLKLMSLRRPNLDYESIHERRGNKSNHFEKFDVNQLKTRSEKFYNEINRGQRIDGSKSDLGNDGECCDNDKEDDCHGNEEVEENTMSNHFDKVDIDEVKIDSEKSWNEVKVSNGIDGSESDLGSDGECCGIDKEDDCHRNPGVEEKN